MTISLDRLLGIFNGAMTYEEYVDLSVGEDRDKHLHYRDKMELTDEEQERFIATSLDAKLLVFCDPQCPDCRIVTATLDRMAKHDPGLQVGLVLKEKHEGIMMEIDEEARIPMVVWLGEKDWRLVFYEIPAFMKALAETQEDEERKAMRIAFQRGSHKEQVMDQILEALGL